MWVTDEEAVQVVGGDIRGGMEEEAGQSRG